MSMLDMRGPKRPPWIHRRRYCDLVTVRLLVDVTTCGGAVYPRGTLARYVGLWRGWLSLRLVNKNGDTYGYVRHVNPNDVEPVLWAEDPPDRRRKKSVPLL